MKKTIILILVLVILLAGSVIAVYETEKDNEGNTIIKVHGKSYTIPKEFEVKIQDEKVSFSSAQGGTLEFKEISIILSKGSEFDYTELNGGITLLLKKGKGTIENIFPPLKGIKNAEIRLNKEREVTFADFVSVASDKEKLFVFEHKGREFIFRTKKDKDARVVFDPNENVVKGQDVEIEVDRQTITGQEGELFSIYTDGRDVSGEENSISISADGDVKAVGMVKIDADDYTYEGRTKSTTFERIVKDGKEQVKIDSQEDKSHAEGGIAAYTKKVRIGELTAKEGSFSEAEKLGITSVISRENGKLQLNLAKESIGILAALGRDPTKFALIANNLELQLGNDANKQGFFRMNTEFGMQYENSQGKITEILSPRNIQRYLGNDLDTVKGIVESQIKTDGIFELQQLAIQKIFELQKEEIVNSQGEIKRFDSFKENFEKTKEFIKESYSNELQRNTALTTFMINNLGQANGNRDLVWQTFEGRRSKSLDDSQIVARDQFIESALSEIRGNLNSEDFMKYGTMDRLLSHLNDKIGLTADSNPENVKRLFEQQFQNKVTYERLLNVYDTDQIKDPKSIIDSYKALIALEETTAAKTERGLEIKRSTARFSTKKLGIGEQLASEYIRQDQRGDAIRLMKEFKDSFSASVNSLTKSTALELGDANPPFSLEEQIEYIANNQPKEVGEMLKLSKSSLELDRSIVANSVFNKMNADLITQKGTLQNLLDIRKGWTEKVSETDDPFFKLGKIVMGGGFGKDIINAIGGFDDVKGTISVLQEDNRIYAKGIYGVRALNELVEGNTIKKWIDGELVTSDLASNLLVKSGRAIENPGTHPEYPGSEWDPEKGLTGRKIYEVGSKKYAIDPEEQQIVFKFLEEVRPDSKNTFYSNLYGSDIEKVIGLDEDFLDYTPGFYASFIPLDIDQRLQENAFRQRIKPLEFSDGAKIANFIDEGLSPGAIAISAITGGVGGTFFSPLTGFTGAGLGLAENIVIDGITGTIIKKGFDVDPMEHPWLTTGVTLATAVITGVPRTMSAIKAAKTANPVRLIDDYATAISKTGDDLNPTRVKDILRKLNPADLTNRAKVMRALQKELGEGSFNAIDARKAMSGVELDDFAKGLNPEELDELAKVGIERNPKDKLVISNTGKEIDSLDGLKRHVDDFVADQDALARLGSARNTLDNEANLAAGGCFLPGTKIMMADGSYKNIEDIGIGEILTAYDTYNDEVSSAEVIETFVRIDNKYRIIEYEVVG